MDTVSKEQRSWNMSRIRSKNTAPELIVRSFLHHNGFRFRICQGDLPGKPDIVLKKYNTVIQVRGCFWHRHPGCKGTTTPKSNIDFWQKKFDSNIARDQTNDDLLRKSGWKVLIIWTCEIKSGKFKSMVANFFNFT